MGSFAHPRLAGFPSSSSKLIAAAPWPSRNGSHSPKLIRRPPTTSTHRLLPRQHWPGIAVNAANPAKDDFTETSLDPQALLGKIATADSLKGDIYGGVTASVVALPLALAFGVASGLGPQAGLYGAIFAGCFAALFGGTPAQITGPTGPMTVVTAASVAQFTGNPALVFTTVFLAGLMQVVMGFLKLGSLIRLVPTVVLTGFMSGIGFIILLTQLPPLFGLPTAPNALAALSAVPDILSGVNPHASLIGLLSLALCTFTPRKITKIVPGSLLALVCGTLVATIGNLNVPCLGHIPSQLPRPLGITLPMEFLPIILKSSFVLAVLGGIDSLLTSLVADSMTSTYHDSDQEMIGQGLGNAVAGIFGGIPSAGATMRTVINIRSGGTTRLAGVIHSAVLLAVMVGLGSVAKNIPLAVLAGILMKTGLDIIDLDFFKRIPKLPSSLTSVMVCVMLMTVFVDLIVAVATGCVLSSLLLVKQLADSQIDGCNVITRQDIQEGGAPEQLSFAERAKIVMGRGQVGLFTMQGSFTFSASNGMLRKVLPKMEKFQASVIDLSNVSLIDGDAALALEEMARREANNGHKLYVCGASGVVGDLLDRMGVSEKLAVKPYSSTDDALQAALDDLGIESSATVCKFD